MKKIALIIPLTLLLTACATVYAPTPKTTTPVTEKNTTASMTVTNITPATEAVPTNANVFKKASEDQSYEYYEGRATISGTYTEMGPDDMNPENLCFYPDEKSTDIIPKHPDSTPWFCFENQAEAKKLLNINDQKEFANTSNCSLTGLATIQISNYKFNLLEAESSDLATLDKLILADPFKKSCAS